MQRPVQKALCLRYRTFSLKVRYLQGPKTGGFGEKVRIRKQRAQRADFRLEVTYVRRHKGCRVSSRLSDAAQRAVVKNRAHGMGHIQGAQVGAGR